MKEVWKDIKNYEGYYLISNLGNVKSLDRYVYNIALKSKLYTVERIFKGKILKTSIDNHGYLQVNLSKNGKVKRFHVHRLVAEAFIPNPQNKPQVNHIDGNRANSNKNNLEWVTDRENKIHAWKKLPRKTTKKVVCQISKNNEVIKEWNSIKEAQEILNITHISECCKNLTHTSGGFYWRYKEG